MNNTTSNQKDHPMSCIYCGDGKEGVHRQCRQQQNNDNYCRWCDSGNEGDHPKCQNKREKAVKYWGTRLLKSLINTLTTAQEQADEILPNLRHVESTFPLVTLPDEPSRVRESGGKFKKIDNTTFASDTVSGVEGTIRDLKAELDTIMNRVKTFEAMANK